jgi:hypothetical protein
VSEIEDAKDKQLPYHHLIFSLGGEKKHTHKIIKHNHKQCLFKTSFHALDDVHKNCALSLISTRFGIH